jgi:hypothetical protein
MKAPASDTVIDTFTGGDAQVSKLFPCNFIEAKRAEKTVFASGINAAKSGR